MADQPTEAAVDMAAEAALVSRFFSRMRVDTWTAEVVIAFQREGIRPVLLKGPAIAGWLYGSAPSTRTYVDADLLVSPDDGPRAEQVLRGLGFQLRVGLEPHVGFETMARGGLPKHARTWIRTSDRANVDLHQTLHGLESIAAEQVWAEMILDTETCVVGGVAVDIPGPAMRTLHVVLHARAHRTPGSQSFVDLHRAISQVDWQTWRLAADLAARLGVENAVGNQLTRMKGGAILADHLGLPSVGSLRSCILDGIKQSELPPSASVILSVTSIATRRDQARFILQYQFPSRVFMVKRYAIATKGMAGLTVSYGVRFVETCTQLPGAWWNWVRFNRNLRRIPPGKRPRDDGR